MAAETEDISVVSEEDFLKACHAGRLFTRQMGFSGVDQACIVTALSELATNLVIHAGGGTITLSAIEEEGRQGLMMVSRDDGPGIENLELAVQDGYSTKNGLGGGLSGIKRLMDEFEIQSVVNQGTIVTVKKWL